MDNKQTGVREIEVTSGVQEGRPMVGITLKPSDDGDWYFACLNVNDARALVDALMKAVRDAVGHGSLEISQAVALADPLMGLLCKPKTLPPAPSSLPQVVMPPATPYKVERPEPAAEDLSMDWPEQKPADDKEALDELIRHVGRGPAEDTPFVDPPPAFPECINEPIVPDAADLLTDDDKEALRE
jgi:hypothetical protein